ncbi:MAG: glycosyltransferase family A protein [Candidatus Nanopelagicales bacterium]
MTNPTTAGGDVYSVVIASRVDDPLLPDAVASIAAQTRRPASIRVVCNPGEPIDTGWVARATRAAGGIDIDVLRSDASGMVSALNHGIGTCSTRYVAFLDTDDVWLPEKQERQLDALAADPRLDAVSCRAANFHISDDGSHVVGEPTTATMFTCTTFRREAFDAYGLIDGDTTHFTWLYRWWGRAHDLGITSSCLDYVGLHRRLHTGNSWTLERTRAHRDLLAEIRAHARRRRA